MSNIGTFTLSKRMDRVDIDAMISASEPINIVINDSYAGASEITVDIASLDSTRIEGFKRVIDCATWQIEEDALIWKIKLDTKTINLESSYVRNRIGTDGTLTDITVSAPLKVRFEVPGFTAASYREIELYYGDDFNPADLTLLDEIGISLSGNGSEFTITNSIECKVSFSKPSIITDVYVIDFNGANTVIPV